MQHVQKTLTSKLMGVNAAVRIELLDTLIKTWIERRVCFRRTDPSYKAYVTWEWIGDYYYSHVTVSDYPDLTNRDYFVLGSVENETKLVNI